MKKKIKPVRIRKGGMENLFLNKSGEWVPWAKASRFTSQDRATARAEKFGLTNYGLFDRPTYYGVT
jgi:hypothetical protein